MMKHEFEALLGKTVTPEEYTKIEYLYANNNLFTNTEGKSQIVSMYNLFGMAGIARMYDSMKADETKIRELQECNKSQGESLAQLAEIVRDRNDELRAIRQNPTPSAAVVDALNYAIAGLLRKRSVYLDAMSAALDAGDRAEYDRVNELDCALWTRIDAMQRELPRA